MPHKFKVGDHVLLIKNDCMNAKIGATATVTGYRNGYLYIEWDRNQLSERQNDGGYYEDFFVLFKKPEPNSFSITLKFLSVDDALKAAEHLAPTYGPIPISADYVVL